MNPIGYDPWGPIETVFNGGIVGGLIALGGTLFDLGNINGCIDATSAGAGAANGFITSSNSLGSALLLGIGLLNTLKKNQEPGCWTPACTVAADNLLDEMNQLLMDASALNTQANQLASQFANFDCPQGLAGLSQMTALANQLQDLQNQETQLQNAVTSIQDQIDNLYQDCNCDPNAPPGTPRPLRKGRCPSGGVPYWAQSGTGLIVKCAYPVRQRTNPRTGLP